MSTLRQIYKLIRTIPSELERRIHRRVLRAHMPDQRMVHEGIPYCGNVWAHRTPEPWPCNEFLRADRAIDDILNKSRR